jgi:hypothetical protein
MKWFYILPIILFILPAAMALEVGASVTNVFSLELRYFNYNNTYATSSFETELFNTGSLAYTAQARIEVSNESGVAFTGWSGKKVIMPGGNAFFRIFWRPKSEGSYVAKVRIYHSGEVLEKEFNITANAAPGEDAFTIKQARTFRNILQLKIESNASMEEAIIIPDNYPKGWAFVEAAIKGIKKGESRDVFLPYTPAVWSDQKIFVDIASSDGKYFSRKEVQLEREKGIAAFLHNILFSFLQ